MTRTNEAAFETVIEAHLLANGYVSIDPNGFDRERAVFPEVVLRFIRETQPNEWAKLRLTQISMRKNVENFSYRRATRLLPSPRST